MSAQLPSSTNLQNVAGGPPNNAPTSVVDAGSSLSSGLSRLSTSSSEKYAYE